MKLAALENAADELIAAQTKLRDLLNEDLRDYFQKMRGLLAYSIACGRTNPDCKLLFDSLGDPRSRRRASSSAKAVRPFRAGLLAKKGLKTTFSSRRPMSSGRKNR
jgi:hypothetical protein